LGDNVVNAKIVQGKNDDFKDTAVEYGMLLLGTFN